MEDREIYKVMIDNDKDFVIDSIIEKNNALTRQSVKIETLEDRISKAIEYIDGCTMGGDSIYADNIEPEELKAILRGKDE